MRLRTPWIARAWLPYSLAGAGWVAYGSVLGEPRGLGCIFIGLACLSLGIGGARWRVLHRRELCHEPPHR
jgi:hypothetical protein